MVISALILAFCVKCKKKAATTTQNLDTINKKQLWTWTKITHTHKKSKTLNQKQKNLLHKHVMFWFSTAASMWLWFRPPWTEHCPYSSELTFLTPHIRFSASVFVKDAEFGDVYSSCKAPTFCWRQAHSQAYTWSTTADLTSPSLSSYCNGGSSVCVKPRAVRFILQCSRYHMMAAQIMT